MTLKENLSEEVVSTAIGEFYYLFHLVNSGGNNPYTNYILVGWYEFMPKQSLCYLANNYNFTPRTIRDDDPPLMILSTDTGELQDLYTFELFFPD